MAQLAYEIHLPHAALSNSTCWSCGLWVDKVPPHQMWPSRVWRSLPGLKQRGLAKPIVHDHAAQQVAGRSLMAGAFEEEPTGAEFVRIVVMYGGEKELAGGRGGNPQSRSLIKIFNTSERPCFDSLKEHGDEKRSQTADCTPPNQEGGERKQRENVGKI